MALTPETIIKAARDLHTLFDDRRVTNQAALRFLSRYQRRLQSKALHYNTDVVTETQNVPYADSLLTTGYTLPAHERVLGATINFSASVSFEDELVLVKYSDRLEPQGRFPAYIKDGVLRLIGDTQDWTQIDSFDVEYVPLPAELTTLQTALVLPDTSEDVMVAAVADFMARIVAGGPKHDALRVDLARFAAEFTDAEETWLLGIGGQRHAGTHYTREVW